ncbi:MAG TPA: SAM-dependent methyltransferase [Kofleriaceae bacterium]|nr:SAM-dependent methyltransferase [Kofleriaceae bacterium]
MRPEAPSYTARAAAAHRAAHQLLEGGRIFADPLAVAMLGEPADAIAADATAHPERAAMRRFIALRSWLAERELADAVARGTRQLVVLGAGLDSFAYRNPHADLRVFEVDHPATQAWKRERLAAAGIAVPPTLAFAPVDFARDALLDALAAVGFAASAPALVTWLGVVPYLEDAAIFATLAAIARWARGTQVVFDYGEPPGSLPPELAARAAERAARVAAIGEPWLSFFQPAELAARLAATGFSSVVDLDPRQLVARFAPEHAAQVPERGGHVVIATV